MTTLLMLLLPTDITSLGAWKVVFLNNGSIGTMSGLYSDRRPIDGYTYIEG